MSGYDAAPLIMVPILAGGASGSGPFAGPRHDIEWPAEGGLIAIDWPGLPAPIDWPDVPAEGNP